MSDNQLEDKLDDVRSRQDLARFVELLKEDYLLHSDDWENMTLDTYLEAMSAWIEVIDAFYENQGRQFTEQPSWKLFAEILLAAKMYE